MGCRGICERYKLVSIRKNNDMSYYSAGSPDRKYCSRCACRLLWSGTNCPCCSFRLRTKPRNYKMVNKIINKSRIIPNAIIEHQPFDDLDILMPMALIAK